MVEERTVSNFTKINSADRANQKASTIVNITKVKQHIRRAPSTVCILLATNIETALFMHSLQRSQRPVVRFCDLAKYIKDEKPAKPESPNHMPNIESANASFTSTSSPDTGILSSTEPSELIDMDLDGVDEEKELDDDLWEEVDAEEEENDQKRMAAAREVASSTVMDIKESEGISLQAPDLLDLLSDSPTISRTLAINRDIAKPKASNKMNSREPKVFQVSDIQF